MTLFDHRPFSHAAKSAPEKTLSDEIAFYREREEFNQKLGKATSEIIRLHSSRIGQIIGTLATSPFMPQGIKTHLGDLSAKRTEKLTAAYTQFDKVVAGKRTVVTKYYKLDPPQPSSPSSEVASPRP